MSPFEALEAMHLDCKGDRDKERSVLSGALKAGRKDIRKANKVRGILEACLRDIHATDPAHKSAIECAWVAIQRMDEEWA